MTINAPSHRWVGPVGEYGPLILFVATYWLSDLFMATRVLIAAALIAVALSWFVTRQIPRLPLLTAIVVSVFGGLTLWLDDETFVKLKPTIVQLLFAGLLFGGLWTGRQPLRYVLGHALRMDAAGWTLITRRLGLFFVAGAVANEIVWRTQSTDFWVLFRFPGLTIVTFLFLMAQFPAIQRHLIDSAEGE